MSCGSMQDMPYTTERRVISVGTSLCVTVPYRLGVEKGETIIVTFDKMEENKKEKV